MFVNYTHINHTYFFIYTIFLLLLSVGCSSEGDGSETSVSANDTFIVPSDIESEVLQRCVAKLAEQQGWKEASDAKKIVCEPEDKTYYGWGVQTLNGIGVFNNLEELIIYSDYLYARQIKDLSPLSALTKLKNLELYNVAADDFTPIENVASIERLTIQPTYLNDLTPISKLENLRYFYLGSIYTYYPLIADFSPLTNLHNLEELHIVAQQYNLRDYGLGFLQYMPGLRILSLRVNYINDFNGLQYLVNLEELDLSYNYMYTFNDHGQQELNKSYLSSLVNIKAFVYESYDGTDIDFTDSWNNLESLYITDTFGEVLFSM